MSPLWALEGLHFIKSKKIYSMVIKMDLLKSNEKANWMYLRMTTIHLGFCFHFVNWVMNCVSSICFIVQMEFLFGGLCFPRMLCVLLVCRQLYNVSC
jgi:hypothetical protein